MISAMQRGLSELQLHGWILTHVVTQIYFIVTCDQWTKKQYQMLNIKWDIYNGVSAVHLRISTLLLAFSDVPINILHIYCVTVGYTQYSLSQNRCLGGFFGL